MTGVTWLDARHLSRSQAEALHALARLIWPRQGAASDAVDQLIAEWADWQGDPRQVPGYHVVWDGHRCVAQAHSLPRELITRTGDLTVMGLSSVCTHPDWRGRGLGAAVVSAALARVDREAFGWALFQTSRRVQPFYERFGACEVEDNRFINGSADDPDADPWWDDVVMRYPGGEGWPAGLIDLCGPGW